MAFICLTLGLNQQSQRESEQFSKNSWSSASSSSKCCSSNSFTEKACNSSKSSIWVRNQNIRSDCELQLGFLAVSQWSGFWQKLKGMSKLSCLNMTWCFFDNLISAIQLQQRRQISLSGSLYLSRLSSAFISSRALTILLKPFRSLIFTFWLKRSLPLWCLRDTHSVTKAQVLNLDHTILVHFLLRNQIVKFMFRRIKNY